MRRYRVLFVCIGNSCRSQMAEAFARRYGSDVLDPQSAGLAPAGFIAPDTRQVMLEKGIELLGSESKGFDETGDDFDLIVNMSGYPLPPFLPTPVRDWKVEDPISLDLDRHREIRDRIEGLVVGLILELRRAQEFDTPPQLSDNKG
ncbi:MAG: arsenate reductase ArsC [Bryobacteraceae bacterium]|jgi:protein-tyrosine-phosphatase